MSDDADTIQDLAHREYKDWATRIGLPKGNSEPLKTIFVEAWIRGFAYRMVNGDNNVREE